MKIHNGYKWRLFQIIWYRSTFIYIIPSPRSNQKNNITFIDKSKFDIFITKLGIQNSVCIYYPIAISNNVNTKTRL